MMHGPWIMDEKSKSAARIHESVRVNYLGIECFSFHHWWYTIKHIMITLSASIISPILEQLYRQAAACEIEKRQIFVFCILIIEPFPDGIRTWNSRSKNLKFHFVSLEIFDE